MLIGELVKTHIPKIFDYCETKDREELHRLMSPAYSKQVFKIGYPFCKEYNQIMKDNEYVRFWKKEYTVHNKDLRVCSQWVITSKDLFLDYLLKKEIINKDQYAHFQKIVQADPNKRTGGNTGSSKNQTVKPVLETLDNITNDEILKSAALEMSQYYTLFYALETSIRKIIVEVMEHKYGRNWWNTAVNFAIRENAEKMMKIEMDTPHAKRSDHLIDYTLFSNLKNIIINNWQTFEPKFNKNQKAIDEILTDINRLRWPIAHCTPMPEDEVERLLLRLRDWCRALKT